MTFRLSLVLFAVLSFSSVASAACLRCVSGTCQASTDNRCTKPCCTSVVGAACTTSQFSFICPNRSQDPYYFTSKMPQQTEGSSLRLQYAPAMKAPPVTCGAAAAS